MSGLQRRAALGLMLTPLAPAVRAQGERVLSFAWWGGGSRHAATLKALRLFEQRPPGVRVKAEYMGYAGYLERLTTQIAGRSERFYNLGGPGDGVHNKVYPFKRKFRPELRVAEPPVTIVLNPGAYRCWDLIVLKGWLGSKRIAKAGFHKGKRAVNQLFSKPRAGQAPDEQGETPRSPNS